MKHKRLAAAGMAVAFLSACQNPFPAVDPSRPANTATAGVACPHVLAFSQRPHQSGDDGKATELRLLSPQNPAGTIIATTKFDDAKIGMSADCTKVVYAPSTGSVIEALSGKTITTDSASALAVTSDGSVYWSPWLDLTSVRQYRGGDVTEVLKLKADESVAGKGKNKGLVVTRQERLVDGVLPGGFLHVTKTVERRDAKTAVLVSKQIRHFRYDLSKKKLTGIKAARDCDSWTASPSGNKGICVSYTLTPGAKSAVSATATMNEKNGKVVATLPADIARLAVEPKFTADDNSRLNNPQLLWISDDVVLYEMNGRNADDAHTARPGAGLYFYTVSTGARTQLTNFPVNRWEVGADISKAVPEDGTGDDATDDLGVSNLAEL
jgi:hypothetical protein